jgi:ElaB/YqjD/DUF883 family membrane-anchored ribosome-binding protein
MQQATQENKPETSGASKAMHNVADKAKEIAGNAGEFVGQAKEKVQEWAHTAKDKIKDAACATGDMAVHAKEKAQEFASTAVHNAGEALQTAGQEVTFLIRKYPIQSVLIGAAVGFLLVKATSSRG